MRSRSSTPSPVSPKAAPPRARPAMLLARAWVAMLVACAGSAAGAGEADVIAARVRPGAAPGRFSFDVTIGSRDRGWDYYAERFEVVAPDGRVLGTRILLHPHENEQPFTRELDDLPIPGTTRTVFLRAWMKRGTRTHAAGGDRFELTLPGR